MNKNDDKLSPLAKRFEQIEKSKNDKKKNKKSTKLFVEPLDLPDINLSADKNQKHITAQEEALTSSKETLLVNRENHQTIDIEAKPSSSILFEDSAKIIENDKRQEILIKHSEKPDVVIKKEMIEEKEEQGVNSTAGVASKRLQDLMDRKISVDNTDISSRLKPQPETRSVSLEDIKKYKLIAKAEPKKKEKKEGNPFILKFLFCLIPAFVAFLIIIASDNVKSLVSQNGIAGTFYLAVLYFAFLSIGMGIKFIISYYRPKKHTI